MSQLHKLSRRDFLKYTGVSTTGLVLGVMVPGWNPVLAATSNGFQLNLFVSINKDDTVNIVCHRSEMGQGIRTGIPQIVADELQADWQKVVVRQGLADENYGSQNTDGSRSIRRFYNKMREMGAMARTMLENAAAEYWHVEVKQVFAEDNQIKLKGSDKVLSFGALAELAAQQKLPEVKSLSYKSSKDFKFIGKDVPIVDMPEILNGQTVFGQDVQLPGMLYASIERTPVVGGKVKSLDKTQAMKVKGVVDVWQMPVKQTIPVVFNPLPGVAVLASNTWAALKGRKALKIDWDRGSNSSHNSQQYLAELKEKVQSKGKVIRQRGEAYAELEQAKLQHAASYTMPYLVHAAMEPPAATAVFNQGMCEIWACTQTPQSTQTNVAQALGIDKSLVKVNVTLLGGGFGRKSKPDFSVEAALLAKHAGKPVKVVWSREDDIQQGYYHAISAQHFSAGLDQNNQVTSWVQRTAFPSISWSFTGTTDEPSDGELSLGFGDLPFAVSNLSCETHKATGHIRIGWVRSVSNIHHAFARGAFVDEMAEKAGISTRQMWQQLIGEDRFVDPKSEGFEFGNYGEPLDLFPIDTKRLKNVLELVVESSGAEKSVAKNQGWGISVHRSFVSYVACAIKVQVEQGQVKVLEAHIGIDAGLVVNPDRVRAQLEGGVIFGLSLGLMGEISVKDGAVEQSNFHDYPVLRMPQSPNIVTYIVPSDAVPGGVGEPGVPPVAAALVNAIYHAGAQRIRELPVSKHLQV